MKRILFTGGPGAGKTTVLNVLKEQGYTVGGDAARSIIRERKAAGLPPRPDPGEFAKQILQREIEAWKTGESSLKFFERGVIDVAGALLASGIHDDQATERLIAEYPYEQVFLFPAWEEIYRMDEERDHTFQHAVRVYQSTKKWYKRAGYKLIEVPVGEPQVRAGFILDQI